MAVRAGVAWAWILGLAGVVPFLALAGVFAFAEGPEAGPALLALVYFAAGVLGFLGGTRWGFEAARPGPRPLNLLLSVLPMLAGWVLLLPLVSDTRVQLGGFIGAFLLQWLWDLRSDLPAWHVRLRTAATGGAVIALAVALEQVLRF